MCKISDSQGICSSVTTWTRNGICQHLCTFPCWQFQHSLCCRNCIGVENTSPVCMKKENFWYDRLHNQSRQDWEKKHCKGRGTGLTMQLLIQHLYAALCLHFWILTRAIPPRSLPPPLCLQIQAHRTHVSIFLPHPSSGWHKDQKGMLLPHQVKAVKRIWSTNPQIQPEK